MRYEEKAARGELKLFKKVVGAGVVAKDAVDAVRNRAPVDHVQGCVQPALAATTRRHDSQLEPVHRNHAEHVGHRNRCLQSRLGQPAGAHEGRRLTAAIELDHVKLKKTIRTAMRMLDNVIDINYYAVNKARNSNVKHRPVGLGIMGFQNCLHMMRVPYASTEAVEFADRSMEATCYYAYWASTELAQERGQYSSFAGSLWDRGILPQDSLALLKEQRGSLKSDGALSLVEVDTSSSMDWDALRDRIKQHGMRNSNCVAIAPTATISNIVGVDACIEPTFQNLFVKSNLSGEFTVVNEYLVRDLKALGVWDEVMVHELKYYDGSLAKSERVPAEVRQLYATAFEIDPTWLIECAARRQKWIDQAQSLNIYMGGVSGRKLDETYRLAWRRGLKTTYYLRTVGATHAEKSTTNTGQLNAVPTDALAGAARSWTAKRAC